LGGAIHRSTRFSLRAIIDAMTLLIFGGRHDVHADAVAWAFEKLAIPCETVEFHTYPKNWNSSVSVSDDADLEIAVRSRSNAPLAFSTFDVVWNRRAGPVAVAPDLAAADLVIAEKHAQTFLNWIRALAGPGQTWVNPAEAKARADNKLLQLSTARRCGLRIPRTLVSNDPVRVRAFVAEVGPAIVKPLRPAVWQETGRRRAMPTVALEPDMLIDDAAIAAAPMIYQPRVDKRHELRVVLFGRELVACRLNSQDVPEARTDFRQVSPHELGVAPCRLRRGTEAALRAFAAQLDVVHGSFDLAVAPDGTIIFFEFNEQGQTLWLEECNPEVRMLDRLVSFLRAPRAAFTWQGDMHFGFDDYRAARGELPSAA
jgi:hypothetical protein